MQNPRGSEIFYPEIPSNTRSSQLAACETLFSRAVERGRIAVADECRIPWRSIAGDVLKGSNLTAIGKLDPAIDHGMRPNSTIDADDDITQNDAEGLNHRIATDLSVRVDESHLRSDDGHSR